MKKEKPMQVKPVKLKKCSFCAKEIEFLKIQDKKHSMRICIPCIKRAVGNLL